MPLSNSFPSPPIQWVSPQIASHLSVISVALLVKDNTIALTSCRSPSVDDNTCIPEDKPIGPYILVSLTLLMISLDHLRGVFSASRDGCVSRAQLQLHHHTVEIQKGY